RASEERTSEAVDLRAMVVEVVLARDVRARSPEQPCEGVADGGPAHPSDVQGARGVRGDELEVDLLPRERVAGAVARASLEDRAGELAGGRGLEGDVEEPRSRDVDLRDPAHCLELGDERLGDSAGRYPCLLRELERDVRGPVAVLALTRSLDVHRLGQISRVEGHGTRGDGGLEGGAQRGRKLSRGHRHSLPSKNKQIRASSTPGGGPDRAAPWAGA